MALSAGLSSLHTVSMSAEALHCPMEEDNSSADMESSVNSHLFSSILLHRGEMNPDCPACQKDNLGVLTSHVSHNHPTQSTLICRVTGKPMDDKNPPMCLPNGMVYSTEVRTLFNSPRPYPYYVHEVLIGKLLSVHVQASNFHMLPVESSSYPKRLACLSTGLTTCHVIPTEPICSLTPRHGSPYIA